MQKNLVILIYSLLLTLCGTGLSYASPYEECVMKMLQSAADDVTVGQIKSMCNEQVNPVPDQAEKKGPSSLPESAVTRRVRHERQTYKNPFGITPHQPNYILVYSYNDRPNSKPFPVDDRELQHAEAKFQVSLKFPLLTELLDSKKGSIFAAYTAKSLWQAYNDDVSSPFRDINHEPEVFFAYQSDKEFYGWKNSYVMAGFSHQSNGRSGSLSRSWNRLYVDFILEKGPFYVSLKPWYRIPENGKSIPTDPHGDDNPDISKFMGYGEFRGAYKIEDHTLSIMLRNNLRDDGNKGAVELGWSFPLQSLSLLREVPYLRGYIQYFNGYGETLIDYNASVNRIGAGFMITDWL